MINPSALTKTKSNSQTGKGNSLEPLPCTEGVTVESIFRKFSKIFQILYHINRVEKKALTAKIGLEKSFEDGQFT